VTPEQYAVTQAAITAGLAAYVKRIAGLFTGPSLSVREWLGLLQLIFPEVQKRYQLSAVLGRSFYDSQRKKYHPDLVRNEMLLTELRWDWFVKNMEPARKEMSQADSPPAAPSKVALAAVREVEMAARRQIIGAVKNDDDLKLKIDEEVDPDDTKQVIGWARVATGRETCAWCLMLISRGAKLNHKKNFAYAEAATAGIGLDDVTAIDLWEESGGDLEKYRELLYDDEAEESYMEKWHVGCDCLAVPVFDLNDWPGADQAKQALQLWIDAGKEADELIKSGKARTTNNGKETLNALRRRLERGDISMSDYAVAA
jgi:hypothetical protein